MKHYKLKIGSYSEFVNIELDIPEEIKFFCNPGTSGHWLKENSEHYTTIVETEKYKDWLEYVLNEFGTWSEIIGKYTVLTIYSLHNDTPVPTIDREEWFKQNNIDLSQYIFVTYDEELRPMYAYKIKCFYDEWNIDVICVTLRDFYSNTEYFSISKRRVEWTTIEPSPCSDQYLTLKTYEGDKAKMIWNTFLEENIRRYDYQPEWVNVNYDFLEEQKRILKEIGFESFKELNNYLKRKHETIHERTSK